MASGMIFQDQRGAFTVVTVRRGSLPTGKSRLPPIYYAQSPLARPVDSSARPLDRTDHQRRSLCGGQYALERSRSSSSPLPALERRASAITYVDSQSVRSDTHSRRPAPAPAQAPPLRTTRVVAPVVQHDPPSPSTAAPTEQRRSSVQSRSQDERPSTLVLNRRSGRDGHYHSQPPQPLRAKHASLSAAAAAAADEESIDPLTPAPAPRDSSAQAAPASTLPSAAPPSALAGDTGKQRSPKRVSFSEVAYGNDGSQGPLLPAC